MMTFPRVPFQELPSAKTATVLKVIPPPCFLGQPASHHGYGGINTHLFVLRRAISVQRPLQDWLRTLLKLQASSTTLYAQSHFLHSLSPPSPLVVDAKSTLNKFPSCKSPFQSVSQLSNQSWVQDHQVWWTAGLSILLANKCLAPMITPALEVFLHEEGF